MAFVMLALAAAQALAGPPDLPPPDQLVAPAPPPFPGGLSERSRAQANLASYVSDSDYPREALANEEEGVVGFQLTIGADGRVSDCVLVSSSGSPSLDETTCRIMTERPLFSPALDKDGNPTEDRMTARIAWRFAEDADPETGHPAARSERSRRRARPVFPLAALPRREDYPAEALRYADSGTVHLRLAVGADGRVSDCIVLASEGTGSFDVPSCRIVCERARFTPARNESGEAVADVHFGHIRWPAYTSSVTEGRPLRPFVAVPGGWAAPPTSCAALLTGS